MSEQAGAKRLLLDAIQGAQAIISPASIAFVACSYDTKFESVTAQVTGRIEQLIAGFGTHGPVDWSLWIVDDLPPTQRFGAEVDAAYSQFEELNRQGRLQCLAMETEARRPGGLKGRALLEGIERVLRERPQVDAVVYLNLNLKVHAALAAPGIDAVLAGRCAVAVGSRAEEDGGLVIGAGGLGRLKSRAYSRLARTLLPPLCGFIDTNAPVKIFNAQAARALVATAQIDEVTLDCEWLMIMHVQGFEMERFPIAWVQREGSRPPWHLIPLSIRDLFRIRRRWKRGGLTAS